jgi:hypothetical protein
MDFSSSNVLGLLIFMALGALCLWTYHRFIYPLLSARHEKAKVTGTQGQDPTKISRIIYLVSLVLFPLIGFLVGNLFVNG